MPPRQALPWLVTVLLAVGVLLAVTGWVLGGGVNRGEALKTGGLAAGSVVALYALWLNDRRRRTEEARQEIERGRQELETQRYALEQRRQDLEHERAEHDRARVADERFARAVELLGNGADQVRVGALHALAGLARNRPAYTQTVLDVLCSYLRRPFDHYRFAEVRGDDAWSDAERPAAKSELQVRMAAQRLIADLLPALSDPDAPRYDLDLHGATLEYFDISYRVVGQIRARNTNLYGSTSLIGARITGPAWFTAARCWGPLRAEDVTFEARAWFSGFAASALVDFRAAKFHAKNKFADADFAGPVSFADARFEREIDFSGARFRDDVDLRIEGGATANTHGMKVSLAHAVELPDGWVLDRTHGPAFGLVRA